MNPNPTDLAPCPFCGKLPFCDRVNEEPPVWATYCENPNCPSVKQSGSESDQIKIWNTRHETHAPQDLAPCCGKRWDEHPKVEVMCDENKWLVGSHGELHRQIAELKACLSRANDLYGAQADENDRTVKNLVTQLAVANNMVEQLGDQVAEMDNEEIESVRRLTAANKRIEELEEAIHRLGSQEGTSAAVLAHLDRRCNELEKENKSLKDKFVPQEKGEGEAI